MLTNVSEGMQGMALQVVRNHPNSWDVQVLRKVVTRTEETGAMGGAPNMGGIGVLDSQDENDYTYEFLSYAHALKGEQFQPGNMTDRLDMPIGGMEEFTYMLAPSKEADGTIKALGFKTKDLVLFVLGIGADAPRAAYEVASVDATCELPPHLPRYVLNRRADMDLSGILPEETTEPDPAPPSEPVTDSATADGNQVSTDGGQIGVADWLSD